ncbi:MAG: IS1595 family transposase [Polaromonas sp.]|uniref:IS1595 family transposase n=1 Tax=Polaromonas sp. TaxID=1869339 RepID=UPI0017F7F58C|nr:IS1595 family transposase [Polaromonas sp.]MBA3592736.1 IS1595 family transposase [Polaromonas sp.]
MAAVLNLPQFQDADKAREYLESVRWANGVICPHCGTIGNHYALEGKSHRPGLYKCSSCRDQFTVTVGTVFERSKIKLHIWLQAVHLICASKKGISSKQLERMLGVTYKTAWFMSHRIREAMTNNQGGLMGSGGGTVEVDETYWGNSHQSKVGKAYAGIRGGSHKEKIVSLVQRGGGVRSFHVTEVTSKSLKSVMDKNISKDANLMTDQSVIYKKPGKEYATHETVNHSRQEYARGHVTTNTVEGYFSILKRGLIGTFHHVGAQHLQRYVNEFDFRYNTRQSLGFNDTERAMLALKGIGGKRLTYRDSPRTLMQN